MIKIKRSDFCRTIHLMIMEIRLEFNLSQLVMANMIGVSKKTYIQLEKQRIVLKWSETITICTIFKDGKVLRDYFSGDIIPIIHLISFDKSTMENPCKTEAYSFEAMDEGTEFYLQYNRISKHYKIVDKNNRTVFISFSEEEVRNKFNELLFTKDKGTDNND